MITLTCILIIALALIIITFLASGTAIYIILAFAACVIVKQLIKYLSNAEKKNHNPDSKENNN